MRLKAICPSHSCIRADFSESKTHGNASAATGRADVSFSVSTSLLHVGTLLMYLDKSVSYVQRKSIGVQSRHQTLLCLVQQHQGAGRKQALCCDQWYFAHVSGQVSFMCTAEIHRSKSKHQNLLCLVLQHQGTGRSQALCCEQWYFAHVSGQVSLMCTAGIQRCIK